MPEYLAPGVYVEEAGTRPKSIEGVSTSTAAMVGLARYGPVPHGEHPSRVVPRLVTSFAEFERVFGGLEDLRIGPGRPPYLAHAARGFFANGGHRLYVTRVFVPRPDDAHAGVASRALASGSDRAVWHARWPGEMGNVHVECRVARRPVVAVAHPHGVQLEGVTHGSLIEVLAAGAAPPADGSAISPTALALVHVDSDAHQTFIGKVPTAIDQVIHLVELTLSVRTPTGRETHHPGLSTHPEHPRYVGKVLARNDPLDPDAPIWLAWDAADTDAFAAARLAVLLTSTAGPLAGGNDGVVPRVSDLLGAAPSPADAHASPTGLAALESIEEATIIAMPDGAALGTRDEIVAAARALVEHAERLRYRFALIDGPQASSVAEVRAFRDAFDSRHAALYHPWVEVADPTAPPTRGTPARRLPLPPSGFVAGIYARSDTARGVHKAPTNEIVRGIVGFEATLDARDAEMLNHASVNVLHCVAGGGKRVSGARTLSTDPEWRYVNVRRLLSYIEHSLERGTQWAVFEPSDERLWTSVRAAVASFLVTLWRNGALAGTSPKEAFFVRCDRSTMTQTDIDAGRLVCVIGVAPIRAAEFVIFRIGHCTPAAIP